MTHMWAPRHHHDDDEDDDDEDDVDYDDDDIYCSYPMILMMQNGDNDSIFVCMFKSKADPDPSLLISGVH